MKANFLIMAFLCLSLRPALADGLPLGMSFIGFTEAGWQAFTVGQSGLPESVRDLDEPREFTWSPTTGRMVFIRADGAMVERMDAVSQVLVPNDARDAFTQIRLSRNGEELIAIRLFERKSEYTALAVWDHQRQGFQDIHQQPGKIFDPMADEEKYTFSVVSCMLACGGILQEAWEKERTTQHARQLTLHNGILRYPVWDEFQKRLVYSLRVNRHFQLWQTDMSGQATRLTDSDGTDLWPSFSSQGALYFVRRTAGGGRLMRLSAQGAVQIKLDNIKDIRDLEITQ